MKDTDTIRVLPDHVANQIAAGEVVERPASVLKELLENALDAKATQIDAEIVAGGKTLVRVGDNGAGMSRNDALLSIERFATSKIRSVAELDRIATLGFRGEALAAISSVSRFLLRTRRAQDLAGTEMVMSAGKIQDVRDQGCAPGTVVTVRSLFFNVPARRKFLRSQQTELFHIKQIFMLYALSHPDAALTLSVDGRQAVNLPEHEGLDQRLADLYPAASRRALRPVDYRSDLLRVTGYAGLPTHSRSDRSEQYLFVNGRPTGAAVLTAAIREAYRGLLPRDRHPMVFLFISIDPSLVDVNVHPTKKEVRFHNPAGARAAVIESIRQALSAVVRPGEFCGRPGTLTEPGREQAAAPHSGNGPDGGLAEETKSAEPSGDLFTGPFDSLLRFSRPRGEPARAPAPGPGREVGAEQPAGDGARSWPSMRVLGQVGGSYIVMEAEDGLVLMDPHAAHERVLFEKLMSEVAAGSVRSHGLLLPETVELVPKDAQTVRNHLDTLKKMGFGISEFGGDAFVVDGLPACLSGICPAALLSDLAGSLRESAERPGAGTLLEERVAQAACKSAVKARKILSSEEIEELIVQLAGTEMPYTCPHGRPTLIHISREDLDRKFGRA